jgi:GDP/UDP-N,N'-diacetylbacillosamine 2-epimerase (hydrolysing)
MKIFLVTSSRADFGLLKNLIFKLNKTSNFDLKIITTGSHFSKKHGFSFGEIKSQKIRIYKKILISNNTKSSISLLNDMNILSKSISSLIRKDNPDLFIVLGDRYEVFAVTLAAYLERITIAHIHGGELTQGSLDDGFRHCITKMSNFHFVTNKIYKKRIIQLGENPNSIYNVGSLGTENISKTNFFSKKDLQKYLRINFKKNILLVCIHPEITKELTINLADETIQALNDYDNKTIIFTMPGSDLFNDIIFDKIGRLIKKKTNCYLFKNLGSQKYLSLLRIADAIIGNSSSGILEMPIFGKPTINIGYRQEGRIKTKSIIDVPTNRFMIKKAIDYIYQNKINKLNYLNYKNDKNVSNKIVSILKKINIKKYKIKKFYDIPQSNKYGK